MESLDAHLRDRILFEAVSAHSQSPCSQMLVCREWRSAVLGDVRRLATVLRTRSGQLGAFKKAFERGSVDLMREMVKQSASEGGKMDRKHVDVLRDAVVSTASASLDVRVLQAFFELADGGDWLASEKLSVLLATAVEKGRIDLARMIAAHLAGVNAEEGRRTFIARSALRSSASLATFRTLSRDFFPDSRVDAAAAVDYAHEAAKIGAADLVVFLLSESDDPEFHGRCLHLGVRYGLVSVVAAAVPRSPDHDFSTALSCAASSKGRTEVVRTFLSAPRIISATTRARTLVTATWSAAKILMNGDVDLGATLLAAVVDDYDAAIERLLTRKISKPKLLAAHEAALQRGDDFSARSIQNMIMEKYES